MNAFKQFIHALKRTQELTTTTVSLSIRKSHDGFELVTEDNVVRAIVPSFAQAKDLQIQMMLPETIR